MSALPRPGLRLCAMAYDDLDRVLLDTALANMMEMAVVQVIDVPFVLNASVAAFRAVLMAVIVVMMGHEMFSLVRRLRRLPFQFKGVGQRILNEIDNVSIRQGVDDVIAFAPPRDQAFGA